MLYHLVTRKKSEMSSLFIQMILYKKKSDRVSRCWLPRQMMSDIVDDLPMFRRLSFRFVCLSILVFLPIFNRSRSDQSARCTQIHKKKERKISFDLCHGSSKWISHSVNHHYHQHNHQQIRKKKNDKLRSCTKKENIWWPVLLLRTSMILWFR